MSGWRVERIYHVVSVVMIVAIGVAGGVMSNNDLMYLATIACLVVMHMLEVMLGGRREDDVAGKLTALREMIDAFYDSVREMVKEFSSGLVSMMKGYSDAIAGVSSDMSSAIGELKRVVFELQSFDHAGHACEKREVHDGDWDNPPGEGADWVEEKS